MSLLRRADTALARAEAALLVVSLLGILGLGVVQIAMRFFGKSLDWGDEVMRNLTLWVGFVGASLATRDGKHINVDALTRFLRPRPRAVVAVLVDLAAAAITAMLLWSATKLVLSSIERLGAGDAAARASSGMPVAVWQAIMPLALLVVCLRFLIKAGESAHAVATGRGLDRPEPAGTFVPHAAPDDAEDRAGGPR